MCGVGKEGEGAKRPSGNLRRGRGSWFPVAGEARDMIGARCAHGFSLWEGPRRWYATAFRQASIRTLDESV